MTRLEEGARSTLIAAAGMRINFHVGGVHIREALLRKVALAIQDGRIRVLFNPGDPDLTDKCFYYSAVNKIETGFSEVTTLQHKAGIVHEAIHAACDLEKMSLMRKVTSEAIGYIAQIRFALYFVRAEALGSAIPQDDAIIQAAKPLAETVKSDPGHRFVDADLQPLRRKILAHTAYSHLTWDTLCTDFNGV